MSREVSEAVRESRQELVLSERREEVMYRDSVRIVERGDTVRVERWVRERVREVVVDTVVIMHSQEGERVVERVVKEGFDIMGVMRLFLWCVVGIVVLCVVIKLKY